MHTRDKVKYPSPLLDRESQFRASNDRATIIPQWVKRLTNHPTMADPNQAHAVGQAHRVGPR